jgi:LacI family transcriptional regulator
MTGATRPSRRPTISDVAARAGVSRAAVSKVLRNAYGLSDQMRTRVEAAITDLGYRPLVSARGLRGATYTIGVVLPDHENGFFVEVLKGAVETLMSTEYQLIMAPIDARHFDGRHAIEALVDRQVDGLLAISPLVGRAWLEDIALRLPIVELGRHDASVNYDTIVGDDEDGVRQVMRHLLEQGHQEIAHFSQAERDGRAHPTTTTAIRRRVYLEEMGRAGLADRAKVINARFVEKDAYAAVAAELAAGYRPSAIFAGNDQSALGVRRALADASIGPVATVGYDDTPLASHPLIDLSSVWQDGVGMGGVAMRLIIERLAGRREAVHHVVHPRLVVRGSSRRPLIEPAVLS